MKINEYVTFKETISGISTIKRGREFVPIDTDFDEGEEVQIRKITRDEIICISHVSPIEYWSFDREEFVRKIK